MVGISFRGSVLAGSICPFDEVTESGDVVVCTRHDPESGQHIESLVTRLFPFSRALTWHETESMQQQHESL